MFLWAYIALPAIIIALPIVLIAWANVQYLARSEEEKAESRKAAAMFFGDDDL